jgi:hypothetical protein
MLNLRRISVVMLMLVCCAVLASAGEKLKPEEVVSRNLQSIGTPEARAAANSRQAEGKVAMRAVVGGGGVIEGEALLMSEGHKIKLDMRFANADYPREQLLYNGDKVLVGYIKPGRRSALGDFLNFQSEILREGLLGGELSAAWPLLDVAGRRPRLTYEGLKSVDGQKLHVLGYYPRKGSTDLVIRLFFEPETFRHVRTTYRLVIPPEMSSDVQQSARQKEVVHTLEEDFSDFRQYNGLTLPSRYKIQYTAELDVNRCAGMQDGPFACTQRTSIWEWDLNFGDISNVAPVSPAK